jgi:hypothetical protein
MPAQAAAGLCRELAARGASEIVFLDPTFNARPDLRALLDGLAGAGLECFAELRAESVTAETASLLAGAGFTGVEVGLQTWDAGVLERTGRPCSPERVLEGARRLTGAGVKTTIDLILGLPGDTPAGPLEAAGRMVEAGLSEHAQVFFASVLPGTGLRDRASELGIEWMDRPPYYATRSGAFDFEDLAGAREQIADLFGYDLELAPRPLMCDDAEGMERFDLDADVALPVEDLPPPPSVRHGVLRLSGRNLGGKTDLLMRHIRRRTSADPFSVLDVILEPRSPVTPALVRRLRAAVTPNDYSSRVAALHGLDGNLRLSVHVGDWRAFPEEGLLELAASCPLAVEARDPSDLPGGLLERDIGIRLPPGHDLTALSRRVPLTDRVFFSSALDERLWTSAILGL